MTKYAASHESPSARRSIIRLRRAVNEYRRDHGEDYHDVAALPRNPRISYILKYVFEWDPRKAEANAAKHGVSFDDAVTVFLDPEALDGLDLQHSSTESRFLRLGRSATGHVLMVAYTFRRSGDAEAIRLISARRASRRERAAYAAED